MAEIIENGHGKKGGGKRKPKKFSASIDMTPMVDLMCLLITFFMLTTAFAKPKAMDVVLPEKPKPGQKTPEIPKSRTLNLLITENHKVYWYVGIADPNKPSEAPTLALTDFSADGIRKVLLTKNKDLFKKIFDLRLDVLKGKRDIPKDSLKSEEKKLRDKDDLGPIVLIKADEKSKYKDIVDIIDEMAICNISKYAIVPPSPYELKLLETAPKN